MRVFRTVAVAVVAVATDVFSVSMGRRLGFVDAAPDGASVPIGPVSSLPLFDIAIAPTAVTIFVPLFVPSVVLVLVAPVSFASVAVAVATIALASVALRSRTLVLPFSTRVTREIREMREIREIRERYGTHYGKFQPV